MVAVAVKAFTDFEHWISNTVTRVAEDNKDRGLCTEGLNSGIW